MSSGLEVYPVNSGEDGEIMVEPIVCWWLNRESRLADLVVWGGEFILGAGGVEVETIEAETEVFLVFFLIKNIFVGQRLCPCFISVNTC